MKVARDGWFEAGRRLSRRRRERRSRRRWRRGARTGRSRSESGVVHAVESSSGDGILSRGISRHRRRGERGIGSWNSRTIIAGTGLRLFSLAGMPSRPRPPPSISSPRGWNASGIWRSHGRGVIRNRRRGERDGWKVWRRESWRPGGRRNEWQSCAARARRPQRRRTGVGGGAWLSSGCVLGRGVDLKWRIARGGGEQSTRRRFDGKRRGEQRSCAARARKR